MVRTNLEDRRALPQLLDDCGLNTEQSKWVEVGVLKGDFSKHLHVAAGKGGFKGSYTGVDIWEAIDMYKGDRDESKANYEEARGNLAEYPRAQLWKMYSVEAAERFRDGELDFVYVDATHLYEDSLADIRAYWPKLKVGGIMAGDDYHNGFVPQAGYSFGVKDAVDEFFVGEKKHRVYLTEHESGGLQNWYVLKCQE
jgi:hypothetical protein